MRPTVILLLAALVAAPMASAGSATVDAAYLESDGGCDHDYHYDGYNNRSGNYSWWDYEYTYHESCRDGATTANASASDGDGEVAAAYAEGGEWDTRSHYRRSDGHTSDHHEEDYYSHQEDWASRDAWSSGWTRDAGVRTTAGDAGVSRGCSDTTTEREYGYEDHEDYESGNHSASHSHRSTDAYAQRSDGCHDTAHASHDGRSASAGRVDQCTSQSNEHAYSSYTRDGNQSEGREREYSHSQSECRDGVAAEGAGVSAFAGAYSECERHSYSSSYYERDGQNYTEWGWEDATDECTSGYRAEGPGGLTARADHEYRSEEWTCEPEGDSSDTRCRQYEQYYVAGLQWDGAPVGPVDQEYRTWPAVLP